jgi:hypothetical protein
MEQVEEIIIKNLFENEPYAKKVSPFLKDIYFDDVISKTIIKKYDEFVTKYKDIPNYDTMLLELTRDRKLSDVVVEQTIDSLSEIKESKHDKLSLDYLVDTTEHRFQEVILEKTVMQAADILASKEKRINKAQLPEMFRDALKLSFKNDIGDIYGSNKSLEEQYYYYHHKDKQYPFPDFTTLNEITRGGFKKKHIITLLAGTNVGKTLCLLAIAEQLIKSGVNVLYISAEIDEEELKERMDGNVLKTSTEFLPTIDKKRYIDKIQNYIQKSKGRLIFKQYPTATANVLHVRALLDELEIKENFKPDFICLDYLNIFTSIRYKDASNSYSYVKGIIEEFRGLAVEKDLGIFTATQTGRNQNGSSNVEVADVSESFGTVMTSDFVLGIIETDDLKIKEQYLMKVLKSRYSKVDPRTQMFIMGVDKDSQRIYEVDNPRDGIITENADSSMDGPAKNLDNRDGKGIGKLAGTNLKGTIFDPNKKIIGNINEKAKF